MGICIERVHRSTFLLGFRSNNSVVSFPVFHAMLQLTAHIHTYRNVYTLITLSSSQPGTPNSILTLLISYTVYFYRPFFSTTSVFLFPHFLIFSPSIFYKEPKRD